MLVCERFVVDLPFRRLETVIGQKSGADESSWRSVQDVFVMQASQLEALENCSTESSALTSVRPPRPTGLRD